MRIAAHVLAELRAAGVTPTLRAMLLGRGFGLSRSQRQALYAGRSVVLSAAWLQAQYREDQHPSFPPSFDAAESWRLEADGDTLTAVS